MSHQDAARKLYADGNGGNSGFVHPPDQFIPCPGENQLVGEEDRPVEGGKIRQVKDPVLAPVFGVVQVLAETVKNTQRHVRMRIRVFLQAMERLVHQLIIPVHRKICDFVHPSGQG